MENLPAPEKILRDVHARIPGFGRSINELLALRGNQIPDWARWCFMPLAGWMTIAYQTIGDDDIIAMNELGHAAQAAGTWQYSKGMYSFDYDLLIQLLASPLSSDIPSNVLLRIPEYCVWIDLDPVADDLADNIGLFRESRGFFAYLEDDQQSKLNLLHFYFPGWGVIPLQLGAWSVEVAIDRHIQNLLGYAPEENAARLRAERDQLVDYVGDLLSRLINLVLYLCSNEPDVSTDRQPGFTRYRPAPVKTKKGLRLFPADKVHIHTVGATVGPLLRREAGAEFEPIEWQGGTKRAHLRRGHWHGFWRGPRKGDREFIFHWIPPLIAGGKR